MVNLTDTATVEDLATPESLAQFNAFYDGYVNTPRLAGTFKTLHVWYDGAWFRACDFPLVADNLDALVHGCSDALLKLSPDNPLPVQPRAIWWDFWRVPLAKFYMNYRVPTHRRASMFVAVRGLRWP